MIKHILTVLFFLLSHLLYAQKDNLEMEFKNAYQGTLTTFQKSTIRRLSAKTKQIFISIDLCDGLPIQFDTNLFYYLQKNKISTLIFVTSKWIRKNPKQMLFLSEQPFFSIQNHGEQHRVPSFQKKEVFGVPCVENLKQLIAEIRNPQKLICQYTKKYPTLYRPATIYHDSLTISICKKLGMNVMAYTQTSYDGVFVNRNVVKTARHLIKKLQNGSIILFHGNHPEWNEKYVLEKVINAAKAQGYMVGMYQAQ